MSALSGYKRRLNPQRLYLAEKVAIEKLRLAKQVIFERVQKDVEFATDVLKAVGDNLPLDLKAECEKTISGASTSVKNEEQKPD